MGQKRTASEARKGGEPKKIHARRPPPAVKEEVKKDVLVSSDFIARRRTPRV